MHIEIVDGWLFYAGPADAAQAEEAGHLVDWSKAQRALDDAGEQYVRNGHPLFRAPLLDGAPAPKPRAPEPPRLRVVPSPAQATDELGEAVRVVFERHLGPREFQGARVPPPEASKALELLDLELAKKTHDLASALVERDHALRDLDAARRELEQVRLTLAGGLRIVLDELERPYDPIAEVP